MNVVQTDTSSKSQNLEMGKPASFSLISIGLCAFLPYLIFLYCCLILVFLGASMVQYVSCPEPFSNAASLLQLVSKVASPCSA